jgi:5-methylcytosine-specific restriction endonuclease McrA
MNQYKTCSKCKQIKTFDEFTNHKSHADGKTSQCRTCIAKTKRQKYKNDLQKSKIANKANYVKHKEKRLVYAKTHRKPYDKQAAELGRKWRSENKELMAFYQRARRAKIKNNSIYYVSSKELKKLKNSPCFYCGNNDLIEIDHIIPIARGGSHGIGNLISACRGCNRSRQDKTIMEWRIWQKKTP